VKFTSVNESYLVEHPALAVGLPIFWVEGGCTWLQTRVFPPRRPRIMPLNSVWIEAHLSQSHGIGRVVWLRIVHSGTANYCRLWDGRKLVYGGEYLSCATHSPLRKKIFIWSSRSSGSVALHREEQRCIGLLADGETLLPVTDMDKCAEIKARLFPKPVAENNSH